MSETVGNIFTILVKGNVKFSDIFLRKQLIVGNFLDMKSLSYIYQLQTDAKPLNI